MEYKINEMEFLNLRGSKPEIDELVQQIVREATLIHLNRSDLVYLYKEKVVLKHRIYSYPRADEERMEAVYRELTNYANIEYSQYTKIVLLIETSQKYPLLMEELHYISNIVKLFPEGVEVKWGLGHDNNIGDKVFLMLICSC